MVVLRFIPVYTGNTPFSQAENQRAAVHPRVYGEHLSVLMTDLSQFGSSPCIRGTRDGLVLVQSDCRFIPVYTGNTHAGGWTKTSRAVHPRVYGEHRRSSTLSVWVSGSSPCIRGTPFGRLGLRIAGRFIPVYTGNTNQLALWLSIMSVHPRVYGEHGGGKGYVDITHGSSPCIRGTRRPKKGQKPSQRFIPVYTGNTPNITVCF